jgi:hypothetical protein
MICINCVKPKPLKRLISDHGAPQGCTYCGDSRVAVAPEFLFDYILDRVAENTATEDDLSQYEYGMLFDGGADNIPIQTLDIVLSEWADLGDEPYYDDLYQYAPMEFKTNKRGMDRHYFGDDGHLEKNFYEEKWIAFIVGIRHSHRFFNPNASSFLDSVFSFLSSGDGDALKPQCVRILAKGERLYRARTGSTIEDVKNIADAPASQLGPTPRDRASSQRMTPNGISALYCSLERETCLSEIRSITGDNVVSVAMTPVSALTLLDLTKLSLVETPKLMLLEKGRREALHLKSFVNSMVQKMSKPKGRNDDLSYLSTQVVFEYLRLRFGSQVDGLVFPSVQTGARGTNVVLFPEASVVSAKNYTKRSEYGIASDDPPTFEFDAEDPFEDGARLFCVSGSVRFHKVKSIETKADEYTRINDLFMSEQDRERLGMFLGATART